MGRGGKKGGSSVPASGDERPCMEMKEGGAECSRGTREKEEANHRLGG